MAREKKSGDTALKVTDKRMFTADGDIKEEFLEEVRSAPEPQPAAPAPPPEPPRAAEEPAKKKTLRDAAENPGTPFTLFLESLIMQGYMSMGMIRNPYDPTPHPPDLESARQMIDILVLLDQKTKGNLEEDESEYLRVHLDQLRLAFVKLSRARG